MKVTRQWLNERNACQEGMEFVTEHKLIGLDGKQFVKELIKLDKLDWANWLIVRVMKRKQYLAYAIYSAEQVIKIYEDKYPEDKRPREAINAAKRVLKKDTKENRAAARDAAGAAGDAAWAARDAAWAARAARDAAGAARDAAWAARDAAWAAGAARDAAGAAAWAAAFKKMQLKILKLGLKILEG